MQNSVKTYFKTLNKPIEGLIEYMYLDVKGLVTVGMGNLIDPIGIASGLPFVYRKKTGPATAGKPAPKPVIEAEWKKIKADLKLASRGAKACDHLATLELKTEIMDELIYNKLAANEVILKRTKAFSKMDDWPADAQLGLLSMAWALGPAFGGSWHHFSAACLVQDFEKAAKNCHISESGNPGVHKRNVADAQLFMNAAVVATAPQGSVYDKAMLYYPAHLQHPAAALSHTHRGR